MLTSKQRAYLRSMAAVENPIVHIGKEGATPEIVKAVDEALEARELIKVAVLNNCLDSPKDIAQIVSERSNSNVVQVIGRKFVLYRESRKKPVIELP